MKGQGRPFCELARRALVFSIQARVASQSKSQFLN